MKFKQRLNKKSAALILSIFVLATILIWSGALFLRTFNENNLVKRFCNTTKAFWAAEAGVQKAIWEVKYNSCLGCVQCNTSTVCTNCVCAGQDKCLSGTITSGDYNAIILAGSPVTITSTGTYPDRNDANRFQRQIKVTLTSAFFTYAIYVKTTISFSNSASTDSYNSSLGLYNVGGNKGSNGDIGTNSTANPAITLSNSAKVNGDASVGGSAATGIVLNNTADITGISSGGITLSLPSVPVPVPPSGSWTTSPYTSLSGSSVGNLWAGSYRASQLALSNSAELNINGDVTLYVTGNINLSNSSKININSGAKLTVYIDGTFNSANSAVLNNTTKIPANFMLYSRYSGSNGINFSNSGSMYGVIYSPDTNITYSNSYETYGALIAKSITLSNSSKVHYDEALQNISPAFSTTSTSNYSIKTWQEL